MVQAVIFDVFGTCVDWRSGIAQAVAKRIPTVDALAFADAWRGQYQPAMERIRKGNRGYVALDDLHLENLQATCNAFDVPCPEGLNSAWEQLDPWADVVPGLNMLKRHHIIAPCSNGSIALMTRLARFSGLPWDCILGADLARDYKPKASVFLASCAALRLPPDRVMMAAAHNDDLHVARDAGLRTAFIPRPTEYGSGQTTDLGPADDWTIVAKDLVDLASQLKDDV